MVLSWGGVIIYVVPAAEPSSTAAAENLFARYGCRNISRVVPARRARRGG